MGCCLCKPGLQISAELPPAVEVLQRTPREMQAACEVITRAFAGSSSTDPELGFDWCMGPELSERDDPRRHSSLRWIFRYLAEESHVILVVRTDTGAIGGVLVLKIFRSKPKSEVCGAIGAGWRAGMPGKDAKKLLGCARMKGFEAALLKLHNAHQAEANVYVAVAAVDPTAQGKGIGGRLMRAASAIADDEGLPCYLETTGSRNPRIYERYGYTVVGQEEMRPQGDVNDTTVLTEFYAMVRPMQRGPEKLFTKSDKLLREV